MEFTEYRFDPEQIRALVATRKANLQINQGTDDLHTFGLAVIEKRLAQDPRRYLDYGPYWWAVKEALRAAGRDFGDQSDPMVLQVYRGDTVEDTLIMADEFRTEYLKTNVRYANKYLLNLTRADWYTVFDSDMEQLA